MPPTPKATSLVPPGRFGSPLFRSKFRLPTLPEHFVHRPRLTRLLDELADYPVTALVAPAGAGKTALAADWVRRQDRPRSWLSLDEYDRDPARFWTALITAMEGLAAGSTDRPIALLQRSTRVADAVHALVDELDSVPANPCVLVVDNLQGAAEPTQSTLDFFLENKPAWVHVLLLSRREPDLSIDRLRAAGALADVRFDALRFSDAEAMAMLTALCPDAPDDLRAAADTAEGWAAALQLAALAIRSGRPEPVRGGTGDRPTASDRLVDEYVWREALHAERDEVIDLLLSTAVVDRVNYGVAEALTGRPEAGDLLLEAESRGLFVTHLGPGGWFEVHSLVRKMLLAELERRAPGRLLEQHARAARWFETVNDETAAVQHWLDAGRPREALRLMAQLAMTRSDDHPDDFVVRMVDRVPPEVASADTAARIEYAWCQLFRDPRGFLDVIEQTQAFTAEPAPSDRVRLTVLRSVAAFLRGAWQPSEELARVAIRESEEHGSRDPAARLGWSLVGRSIALQERWSDQGSPVAEVRTALSTDPVRRTALEATRAVGLALAGQPIDALRVAAGVRRAVDTAELPILRSELAFAEAVATGELGDGVRSQAELELLASEPSGPIDYVPPLAQLELVDLRLHESDRAGAASFFAQAEELSRSGIDGLRSSPWLARRGMRLALADGDLDAAGRWVERIEDTFWRPLCEAKLHLTAGRSEDAVESVMRARPRCARHRLVSDLVRAKALVGQDHDSAMKAVTLAVDEAAEHGMVHTVSSEGRDVLELVERAAWRAPSNWMERVRRASEPAAETAAGLAGLVERLTEREREVLRLLPSRLTLREISSELFISHNTLKFHLRVIYRKLGVSSRSEAVEYARQMRLLASGSRSHGSVRTAAGP